ncbi:hypothetical protein [Reticulibacter mediterranei]|uniref:hypothetical protein n=1 Tax=Reticulibacter mediterranei TaxID=2778369 RepID=UPI001C6886B8|nr:hypothetical protein [Reticulibacter mediterranei]
MLEQVATGLATCFAPASMSTYYARPDLAWRPIVDIEPLSIAIARWVDETDPLSGILCVMGRATSRSVASSHSSQPCHRTRYGSVMVATALCCLMPEARAAGQILINQIASSQ